MMTLQLLICAVVLAIIFSSFQELSSHHHDSLQSLALKDSEEGMKEMVNNTIVHMDLKRKTSLAETAKLIDLTAQVLRHTKEAQLSPMLQGLIRTLSETEYGTPIQILICNAKEASARLYAKGTLTSFSSPSEIENWKEFARSSKLYKSVRLGSLSIFLFAKEKDVDEITKRQIYQEIHNAAYSDNEYIWVNEILDFSGGDHYAIRRIHPNLKESEGAYLSTNQPDIQGNLPYLKELNGIKERGEVLQTYYFKNKTDDTIAQKISYAKLYKPFQWVVAAGKPLHDIFLYTNEMQQNDVLLAKQTTAVCFFFILVVFLLGNSLLFHLHKRYHKKVSSYVKTETELDPLTGAFNRTVGEGLLAESLADLGRSPFCPLPVLMLFDIDYLKRINDTYGYDIGNIVLKKVAQVVLANKNENDSLFRLAGSEFVLLCRAAEGSRHTAMGKKLLRCVSEIAFEHNEACFHVTLSIGSSCFYREDTQYEQPLRRARLALEHAKNMGKNQYANFEDLSLEIDT